MELRDTSEEAAFRAELREWLEENVPDSVRGHRGGAARFDGPEMREWSRALYEAGYAGLTWPEEYGGAGAPYTHQAIFLEEMARAEAPPHIGVIGIGMAGPTIIAHGTDEQKSRHLAQDPLRRGDLVPGVLRARGRVRPRGRPHELRASTTATSSSTGRRCGRRSRTSPTTASCSPAAILGPTRHAGLTYLIVDMHSPGVEVRPLRQITGEAEFNEIFFTDVACRPRTCSARSAAAGRSR